MNAKNKPAPKTQDEPRVAAVALVPDRLGRHVVELLLPQSVVEQYIVAPPNGPHDMAIVQGLLATWAERQGQR